MRAFRGVCAALLKRFLSTGPKSFAEIEQYLDTVRLHPTGKHWVDNFMVPTLLVHQFERAEREGDLHLKHLTLERMMKYFFVAGHAQYARYLTQYLIDMRVQPTLAKANMVCRHQDGYWNAVSADQFGEQTAIKTGKGALKGMTLRPELVSEWIDSFPIMVHVSDRVDQMYSPAASSQNSQQQHKEEMKHRRMLDARDRALIETQMERYPHPLEDHRPHLYNPVTGQIASSDVTVTNSIEIGEQMERNFIAGLPEGFYKRISSPIKTMSVTKNQAKMNISHVIDMETIFLRLLMIGQKRSVDLKDLFQYELCAVPASLIDEHGCLRKSNKSGILKRLQMPELLHTLPDSVIVDVSQLLYHIVWPHGGTPAHLIEAMQNRLARYAECADIVCVFDKYPTVSAKDHERLRRGGDHVIEYDLALTSPLPKRDVVMKCKRNKRALASILTSFNWGPNITLDSQDEGLFHHEEADVTMVSYVLEAAKKGHRVVRVLSDDTDVFVLLVYWTFKAELNCKVQLQRWDGTLLDINATCAVLGEKCLQLLGVHAITGCDTTSFLYGKGKLGAVKTLLDSNFIGLANVLGEELATKTELMEAVSPFVTALYGQPQGTSMESARFALYTSKKKVQNSGVYLQHQAIYNCTSCVPTCRLCCGKRQTRKVHQMPPNIYLAMGGK